MIDTEKLELTGTLHDPKNLIGRVGVTGNVFLTMINGKIVYQDEKLIGIDEKKLAVEGNKICENLLHEGLAQFS